MLASNTYDLVLMDIQMPVMNGIEATRAIRDADGSDGIDPDIPIIAMTAHAMKGDRENFLSQGMNDYIPKPVDPDVMAEVLAKYY
jgi:CheY-like chemotaxis protein